MGIMEAVTLCLLLTIPCPAASIVGPFRSPLDRPFRIGWITVFLYVTVKHSIPWCAVESGPVIQGWLGTALPMWETVTAPCIRILFAHKCTWPLSGFKRYRVVLNPVGWIQLIPGLTL